MDKPQGSLISYFSELVTKHQGINLAQGKPGFAPPRELLTILKRKIEDETLHQYAPGNGDGDLLRMLAQQFSRFAPIDAGNILITQGATEGISLAFLYLWKILKKPFTVLSFEPVYESYLKLPEIFALPFVSFDLGMNLEVDFNKLENLIKKERVMIIFIASPGNPLGKSWSGDELAAVVSLSKKYGFYIVFDAVYKDLYFDTAPFNPLSFNYEKLFYVDSFSKMLSITGWRIGYIIAPEEPMIAVRDIHDYTGLSAVSIFQRAIFEYLDKYDGGKEYVAGVREKCKSSFNLMKAALEESGFWIAETHGGYFLWARLPEGYNDAFNFALELCNKANVAVVPGENFSLTKKNYLRLNIALEISVIREAAERIRNFLLIS